VDGQFEDDNVVNTGLTFKRLDLKAALDGIGAPPQNPPASNTPPTMQPIPDQTITVAQHTISITLQGNDADGDILTYSAVAQGYALAYQLRQQLGLSFAGTYYTNSWGLNEKWLLGNSNQWYFILPNGELHRWLDTV